MASVSWQGIMNLDAYHVVREIDAQPFRSACYAPFVGMSFDVFGFVSVCSFSRATPLGRVGDVPLIEMWTGPVATAMRDAVRSDDLGAYCGRCAEEIAGGNLHGVLAHGFDRFVARDPLPWPTRIEFALSNTCNLECVMCSGDFSSSIRSRREALPPLASAYPDEFIDELEPFLPDLEQARFLGGEPFLSRMNFRIWERMIAVGSSAECNVTTNGTQWNTRVESVLDQLPFSIGVSIDGVRPETVESIRTGASYGQIMANLQHFINYRDRRGTSLSVTFCLMVDNWQEFGDFLVFGEERGCRVHVNTVRQPAVHSLYQLPTNQLSEVLDSLHGTADVYAARLDLNRDVWTEQLERLSRHLDERRRQEHGESASLTVSLSSRSRWDEFTHRLAAAGSEPELVTLLADASPDGSVSVARFDPDDRLSSDGEYLGVELARLRGTRSVDLSYAVMHRLGSQPDMVSECVAPGSVARVMVYRNTESAPTFAASVVRRDGEASTARFAAIVGVAGR
jgi:MoaA/NifB/PqqE/SkfB family radical SAM enzyme